MTSFDGGSSITKSVIQIYQSRMQQFGDIVKCHCVFSRLGLNYLEIGACGRGCRAVGGRLHGSLRAAARAQARADLERHWPKDQPPIGHVAQGRLLSSLRTNPTAGHPCVTPTLLAIGREVLPDLSETDADRISQAVVAAVINARFAHSLLSGMHRCESGRQLQWGLLIHCEPHPGGKDRVDYQLAVAVSP